MEMVQASILRRTALFVVASSLLTSCMASCVPEAPPPKPPIVAPLPPQKPVEPATPAPKTRLEQLTEACEKGTLEACGSLGQSYFDGRDAPKDDARAIPLLRTACDGGVPSACNTLGEAFRIQDPSLASMYYTTGCDKGSGKVRACVGLAAQLLDGSGVPKDEPRGRAILETACDGDEPSACSYLGLLHVEGLNGVAYNVFNQTKGARYYEKACRLGEPRGCYHMSQLHRSGTGVIQNDKKADSYLRQACDSGDTVACAEIEQREENKKKTP